MAANEEITDLGEMSWSEIQSVVAKVKDQLGSSNDAAGHQLLRARLVEAKEALAEIESRWNEDRDEPAEDDRDAASATPTLQEAETGAGSRSSVDELLAELLVDDDEIEPSRPNPEIVEAATTTARRKHRRRAPGAAMSPAADRERTAPQRREGPDQLAGNDVREQRRSRPLLVVGAFVLAAVAGSTGVFLLTSTEASDDPQVEDVAESTRALEEFREVVTILDVGPLDLEWEGSVLRISGTVASTEQLQVVRETAAVMVDYGQLDTSGVIVDQPLIANESVTATDGDRQAPKLQRDLERLLRTTPIMFEPGESDLSELDQRILNAAVVLIRSTSQTEIEIIGHADQAGTGRGDVDLAAARVAAVHDYLVQRGISPDLLISTGRATLAPDAAPSAVELLVITEPPNS